MELNGLSYQENIDLIEVLILLLKDGMGSLNNKFKKEFKDKVIKVKVKSKNKK